MVFNRNVVGQIEYSPPEVSYYPLMGDDVIVMNCVWVLRKAGGHNFGKQLVDDMIKSEKDATGFATIALENHWSPWFKKGQMERLGFKSVDSIQVSHKTKYKGRVFTIYLMWKPTTKKTNPPTWDTIKLLEGIIPCIAHPLYHPQSYEEKQILISQIAANKLLK